MPQATETPSLHSKVLYTKYLNWKDLKFIQQDNFKELPAEAREKLKSSLISNQFTQPFYVWHNPEDQQIYCLDGKHRTLILEELASDGHVIPDQLPATFIDCKDKKDAARLVLVYSSIYARVTETGMHDFINQWEMDLSDLMDSLDIPGFSIDHYTQRFDQFVNPVEEELRLAPYDSVVVKPGDLFEINGHRIMCESSTSGPAVEALMGGKVASAVFTSPPYNMKAGLYADYKDDMSRDAYLQMNRDVIANVLPFLSGYLFYNISYNRNSRSEFIDILAHLSSIPGCKFLELIVWNKKTAMPVQSDHMLTRKFEQVAVISTDDAVADMEIYYVGSNRRAVYFNKRLGKTMSNYWEIPVSASKVQFEDHQACFPVELPSRAIQLITREGEIIIDPFFGMGTTLIASDNLGRICYGVDLSPVYVQSSINRYVKYCRSKGKDISFRHLNGSLKLKELSGTQEPG